DFPLNAVTLRVQRLATSPFSLPPAKLQVSPSRLVKCASGQAACARHRLSLAQANGCAESYQTLVLWISEDSVVCCFHKPLSCEAMQRKLPGQIRGSPAHSAGVIPMAELFPCLSTPQHAQPSIDPPPRSSVPARG